MAARSRGSEPEIEPLEWDPVVDDLHSPRCDPLVVDQGLANRLANRHHPVASSEQYTIGQLSLHARVIRMVPAVLGEEHGEAPSPGTG